MDDEDEDAKMSDLDDVSLTPEEKSGKKKQKREQNTYGSDTVSGADPFNGATVYLPHNDRNEIAKILGRKKNPDGSYVGRRHKIPTLDSRIFTVQFPDGSEKDMAYNILAEHLFLQVDSEGNQYRLFKGIVGHRRLKNAVGKADAF